MGKDANTHGWAPADPRRWPAGCTPHRDGWCRWYKGRSRHVAGRKTPLADVENKWIAKKKAIDAGEVAAAAAEAVSPARTYRTVLSEFLAIQQARVGAARDRIEARTYHNKVVALNAFGAFVVEGVKVADTDIREIGPRHFTAYAQTMTAWKASGFDSVVSRVAELFRWAVEMEYIDRYRPGPQFVRPARQEIRDQRMALAKSFTPDEFARLYHAAGPTMRLWLALGICAAFNNSDLAHLTRDVVDLTMGVIDFRRRKTGKVRRVVILPPDVADLLRAYARPEPRDPAHADLFFVSRHGNAYGRTAKPRGGGSAWKPSDSISRLFRELMAAAGVEAKTGRNFSGLRTTFYNLCPRGEWDTERKIVMGRAQGTVDLDAYLEDVGAERLRHVVNHVWGLVKCEIDRLSTARQGAAVLPAETPSTGPAVSPPASPAGARGQI